MFADERHLGVTQASRAAEDLGRHGQLAEVVDACRQTDGTDLVGIESQLGADRDGEASYTLLMTGGIRVAILPAPRHSPWRE